MKELRDYQEYNAFLAHEILSVKKIVYLSMEVRTGKTVTAFETARNGCYKNILFLTKKKAVASIEADYLDFGYKDIFNLTVINDESLHTVAGNYDLIIHDEHHRFGAFAKPNKIAKMFKLRFAHLPMIFLSGTPTPESYSQIYHQFWVSNYSPFNQYQTFYIWAKSFVNIKQKHLGYATVNDYSDAKKELIDSYTQKYFVTYTQQQAGFNTTVNENILYCEMKPYTYQAAKQLKKDLVIQGTNEVILADTGVKLMQKLHQIWSGTVKFESGNSMVLDYTKAEYIYRHFENKKIGIFYKFKEELNALKKIFCDNLTTDLEEFKETEKSIALQIVAGREGISLSEAEYLVYYNIDFSAVSYWQSRDRLTNMQRLDNEVFWIFAKGGIEDKIYKSVMNKKNYTLSNFKRDHNVRK